MGGPEKTLRAARAKLDVGTPGGMEESRVGGEQGTNVIANNSRPALPLILHLLAGIKSSSHDSFFCWTTLVVRSWGSSHFQTAEHEHARLDTCWSFALWSSTALSHITLTTCTK